MKQHDQTLALAQKKLANGNAKEALTLINKALQTNAQHRDWQRMRAHILIRMGDMQSAIQDLVNVIKIFPDDHQSYNDLGVIAHNNGDYANAATFNLKASELAPGTIPYMLNLAASMEKLGQYKIVENLSRDVLKLDPNNGQANLTLANACETQSQLEAAEQHLKLAIANGFENFTACMVYGNICRQQKRVEEGIKWYQKAVNLMPENKSAQYMLAAMKGETLDAPPEEFVANLFDTYANSFEESLVGKLKYHSPEKLFSYIEPTLELWREDQTHAIDLGAGTGLFGKLIRPYIKESLGLDLSQKMLDKAQAKNIYDRTMCVDIVKGLQSFTDGYFDLISAADVFVYIGNLEPIFAEIWRTLKTGGLFVFTTEAPIEGEDGPYTVRDTGRYAHSEGYIRDLAGKHAFTIDTLVKDDLRYNRDVLLMGYYGVLRK